MKQKNLWILCGPSGAGKSTYVKKLVGASPADFEYVSRDEIRFSLLEKGEDYFAHENEVFKLFIQKIQKALDTNGNVFADATHLTEKSRNNTLNKLKLDNVNIMPISFEVSLDTCLTQNAKRKGRAYVPSAQIERMYNSFTIPSNKEKYKYERVIHIKEC